MLNDIAYRIAELLIESDPEESDDIPTGYAAGVAIATIHDAIPLMTVLPPAPIITPGEGGGLRIEWNNHEQGDKWKVVRLVTVPTRNHAYIYCGNHQDTPLCTNVTPEVLASALWWFMGGLDNLLEVGLRGKVAA